MLNQSRDPTQLRGSAHLCKLDSQNSGELRPPKEIFLSLQTNYYELFMFRFMVRSKNFLSVIWGIKKNETEKKGKETKQ